ncbi:MAG: hypothetical protein IPN96_02290 [Anaerolineales bacterium]|nr:hypothetical protein [Anaerolineales bacterium]
MKPGATGHHGNYETALGYLKQSLTIRQQIGDKAGEGRTNRVQQGDTRRRWVPETIADHHAQIGDKAGRRNKQTKA